MDRFNPYDSPGQQRQQAQALQAALEMEEALYLQRQQEMQRDLQIRQMLLQDQIDQQLMQAPASMLQQQRLYDIQNYGQNPLAALHEEQLLQQQLQQQEQIRRHQLQQELQLSAALANQQSPSRRDYASEALLTDSLPAPPITSARSRKRTLSQEDVSGSSQGNRKQAKAARSNSIDEAEPVPPPAKKKARKKSTKKPTDKKTPASAKKAASGSGAARKKSAQNGATGAASVDTTTKGTVETLMAAAQAEQQVQDAASAVVALQDVEWSDSESEEEIPAESIELPGFSSKVPRLPEEPEYSEARGGKANKGSPTSEKGATDAHASLQSGSSKKAATADAKGSTSSSKTKTGSAATDYPFPVDTWWPSNTTVRRERRIRGERSDEEDAANDSIISSEDSMFRVDMPSVRRRLINEVEPGVLEKLPHCKIHQVRARKGQKGGGKDPVFCFQVTENTCNDVMLCCSICSTWRHAFCGGHYKPYTIQSMVESNTPFSPVCDRCHEEKQLLRDFPNVQSRIERQRTEQLRRGLSTSAVIRQASFAKHGGTYKWPLGSVSATHIGGHTRSVHSRHDKAEKQWSEMAVRLGRGVGYRPKERVKVRTRELERLLVSVEDAEGITDRHNMMLFLQNDSSKDHPVGFDRNRRNLFDPEDDYVEEIVSEDEPGIISTDVSQKEDSSSFEGEQDREVEDQETKTAQTTGEEERSDGVVKTAPRRCARKGCRAKPRFDSIFCSDSCGVSALEFDLFRSMEFAGDIHPSLLRT